MNSKQMPFKNSFPSKLAQPSFCTKTKLIPPNNQPQRKPPHHLGVFFALSQ